MINWNSFPKFNILRSLLVSAHAESSSKLPVMVSKKTLFRFDKASKILVAPKGKLNIGVSREREMKPVSNCSLASESVLQINGYCNIHSGCRISLRPKAKLILGNCYLNYNCTIICSEQIEIGDGTAIAPDVLIRDSDDHYLLNELGQKMYNTKPIKIGQGCWIGSRTIILKGVTIGDNCVVAAGSVVTKDIPANCLAAGVPAKVIRENVRWEH